MSSHNYKEYVQQIIKDPKRKSWGTIFFELLEYTMKKKELPANYFGKFLYRKNTPSIDSYLSKQETDTIMYNAHFHRLEYATLLQNKLAFALHMENMKLKIPTTYGYNTDRMFFDGCTPHSLKETSELVQFFERLFEKYDIEKIFVKPIGLKGGFGCFIVHRNDYKEVIPEKSNFLLNNACIFQEALIQHEELNKIHGSCINSIRFDTYIDNENNYHILSAAMRFGAGKSVVDNASSGGFFVLIDMENQCLTNYGRRLMRFGGAVLDTHPDSGFKFGGHKIPYFKEACELTLQAMKCIPDKIVGWDIAITQNGPVLVEGNHTNSFFASDIVTEGYKRNPLVHKILEEVNEVTNSS